MNRANVHQLNVTMQQQRQDGVYTMKGLALTQLLQDTIREYGKYDSGCYSVFLNDINQIDKKLLLSHIADNADYEFACESQIKFDAVWNEYASIIEDLLDQESYEVYREDMEEMGMSCKRHADNNETYWMR
jgi:hypothetical protein